MKNPSKASRILDYLANNPGRHKTCEIAEAIGVGVSGTSPVLTELVSTGEITKIKQGIYTANNTGDSVSQQTVRKSLNELRESNANKETIDILLNTYDLVLAVFQSWILKNIDNDIDFAQQLLFIENFKWLTAIADKLMKRWSLEHVGYDTNTRQAHEDAKAETAKREKAALEDAPLEETVHVVGHYHTDLKELWDAMPEAEKEKRKA